MRWTMNPAGYLTPLKKWEDIRVEDDQFILKGHAYQDERLKGHDHVTVLEYEGLLGVFDVTGRAVTELNKDAGQC